MLPRFALPTPLPITTAFSLPFRHQPQQQCRYASILSSLRDNKGAYNKRIRRGRGPSSGKGKTSGRGHKGQRQHGKVPAGFEGGQTPLHVVHGERGFSNQFSLDLTKVNIDRIQSWIDQGRLDISRPITVKEMHRSRLTHGIKDGVKLLARNADQLRSPIHITVSRASAAAIAAVEAAGGSVTTRYYTHQSIRRIMQGETHPTLSLMSQAPSWLLPPSTTPSSIPSAELAETTPPVTSDASTTPAPGTTAPIPLDKIASKATKDQLAQRSPNDPVLAEIRKYKYRLPDPAGRKDLEYYRDPAHRGYLSYQLQPGQNPSLFFKTPSEDAARGVVAGKPKKKGAGRSENKIW